MERADCGGKWAHGSEPMDRYGDFCLMSRLILCDSVPREVRVLRGSISRYHFDKMCEEVPAM